MVIAVLVTACGEEPPADTPTTVASAPAVSVTRIQLRPIAEPLTVSGLLVAREEASVSSEIAGYAVSEVLVEEGALVTRGQPLVRLNPDLLLAKVAQAEAAVKQAAALAEQAEGEAERVRAFDDKNVMSAEQIAARRFQAQTARASAEVALAQLNDLRLQREKMTIAAPVAGVVLERTVRPGDVVTLNQPLFRIARDQMVELDAEIPEAALVAISPGETAQVKLPSGAELEGVVRLISPRVDPMTKLGRVRISLPHHPQLRVGGYGRANFELGAGRVASVPEKAVHFEASGPQVIMIDENNQAHPVPVQTGARAGGFVVLEQGPPVGTMVALSGGVFLLEGDSVTPVGEAPLLSSNRLEELP